MKEFTWYDSTCYDDDDKRAELKWKEWHLKRNDSFMFHWLVRTVRAGYKNRYDYYHFHGSAGSAEEVLNLSTPLAAKNRREAEAAVIAIVRLT